MTRRVAAARGVHLAGPPIAAVVVPALCDALAPAQRAAWDEGRAPRQRDQPRLARDQHQQGPPARVSAPLARRRYAHVAPQSRLAAAARERDWDEKLRALRQAAAAAARLAQGPAASPRRPARRAPRVALRDRLPAWWARDPIRHDQRKALGRSLLSPVLVTRPATDRGAGQVLWGSGHASAGPVRPPVLPQRPVTGDATMVERRGQWWAHGATAGQIAETLRADGWRAARRDRVVPKPV